jgi:hypothetical protein
MVLQETRERREEKIGEEEETAEKKSRFQVLDLRFCIFD